jgi:hypothetical protein
MMMALRVVLAVSTLYASTAYSVPTSDTALEDDLAKAKSSQSVAQGLWAKNQDACLTRDTSALAEIMRSANDQLRTHGDVSASRFSGCRLLLSDVLYFNGGCYTGNLSQRELDRVRDNWTKDNEACAAQLANPSGSSPETLSEGEWEAQERRDGTSEDDIQMMKAIRHL